MKKLYRLIYFMVLGLALATLMGFLGQRTLISLKDKLFGSSNNGKETPLVTKSDAYFEMPKEVKEALFENNGLYREFDPNTEIKEKRDEFSKHFKNKEGGITAIVGAGPLHYMSDNIWKTILSYVLPNNTQEFTDRDYAMLHNSHKIYFPKSPGKSIVTKLGKYIYKDWGQPAMVWLDSNANILLQIPLQTASTGQPKRDSLVYRDIFPHTDAVLINPITSKKLNYILKDPAILSNIPARAAFLAFKETINTDGSWKLTGKASEKTNSINSSVGLLLQNIMFVKADGGDSCS